VFYEFGSLGAVGGYRVGGFTINATTRLGLGRGYLRSDFTGMSAAWMPSLSLGLEAGYGF